jgi:hypothetical protein
VSAWSDVFLGVIAAATLLMAIGQVGALIAAGRLARRLNVLAERLERELGPAVGYLTAMGRDGSRVAELVTAQVERVDRLLGDLAQKVEDTLALVQSGFVGSAREGRALLLGLRAALEALADARRNRAGRAEDEDALFI